jgi:hypothetical protein
MDKDVTLGCVAFRPDPFTKRNKVRGKGTVIPNNTTGAIRQSPDPKSCIEIAKRNIQVARALRLFNYGHSWTYLYKLLEVIELDIGGERKIINNGWAAREKLMLFKGSAKKEHHTPERFQPQEKPMTLANAKSFIRTILNNWLDSKCQ